MPTNNTIPIFSAEFANTLYYFPYQKHPADMGHVILQVLAANPNSNLSQIDFRNPATLEYREGGADNVLGDFDIKGVFGDGHPKPNYTMTITPDPSEEHVNPSEEHVKSITRVVIEITDYGTSHHVRVSRSRIARDGENTFWVRVFPEYTAYQNKPYCMVTPTHTILPAIDIIDAAKKAIYQAYIEEELPEIEARPGHLLRINDATVFGPVEGMVRVRNMRNPYTISPENLPRGNSQSFVEVLKHNALPDDPSAAQTAYNLVREWEQKQLALREAAQSLPASIEGNHAQMPVKTTTTYSRLFTLEFNRTLFYFPWQDSLRGMTERVVQVFTEKHDLMIPEGVDYLQAKIPYLKQMGDNFTHEIPETENTVIQFQGDTATVTINRGAEGEDVVIRVQKHVGVYHLHVYFLKKGERQKGTEMTALVTPEKTIHLRHFMPFVTPEFTETVASDLAQEAISFADRVNSVSRIPFYKDLGLGYIRVPNISTPHVANGKRKNSAEDLRLVLEACAKACRRLGVPYMLTENGVEIL